MIVATWSSLARLTEHARGRLVSMASVSVGAGLLEAATLVVLVRVALSLEDRSASVSFGPVRVSPTWGICWAAVALLGVALLHLVFARLVSSASADVQSGARRQLVDAYQQASTERQMDDDEGALQHGAALAESASYLALLMATGVAAALNAAVLVTMAAFVDLLAAIVMLAGGVVVLLILMPIARSTRRHASDYVSANAHYVSGLAQQARVSREVRMFGVEEASRCGVDSLENTANERLRRARFASTFGGLVYRDIALLALITTLGILVAIDVGELAGIGAVVILLTRAISYAQGLQNARQAVSEHGPKLEELLTYIESLRNESRPTGGTRLEGIEYLEFTNVTYRYGNGEKDALVVADLRIQAGEFIGLVGPSGGGKSTLLQLLSGLRHPSQGQLVINGLPIESVLEGDMRRLVASVPQETHLISETIRENVRFYRPWITDAEVDDALEKAHLAPDLVGLAQGAETVLGPGGSGLSGGQRQRLAIARALAGSPQLLVMDEPTSALDPLSEKLIAATISELHGSITLVISAHRYSTIEGCDRVLEVLDGIVSDVVGTEPPSLP